MDKETQQFEEFLQRLDRASHDATPAGPADPGEVGTLAQIQSLAAALRSAAPLDERHYELSELEELAEARRTQAAQWEMPGHLACCPLCVESFEAILTGLPEVSQQALERWSELAGSTARPDAGSMGPPRSGYHWFGLAAAILVAAGVAWFNLAGRSSPARLEHGTLTANNGQPITAGGPFPEGQIVLAHAKSHAVLQDGSELDIEQDSRLSVESTRQGQTVYLEDGELLFSVVKQSGGKSFRVRSELGEIIVIGTRFSVSTSRENVTIYKADQPASQPQRVETLRTALTVRVLEGVVLVKNKQEQWRVRAGQTAVLRRGEPKIDISGG